MAKTCKYRNHSIENIFQVQCEFKNVFFLILIFFKVRQEPGKVRMGFVPEEWFQFFYKKTGVTGPYTFAFTLSTYLVSKEIYVLEHEYYTALSLLVMWVYGIKKLGPKLATFLDKEIDVSSVIFYSCRFQ